MAAVLREINEWSRQQEAIPESRRPARKPLTAENASALAEYIRSKGQESLDALRRRCVNGEDADPKFSRKTSIFESHYNVDFNLRNKLTTGDNAPTRARAHTKRMEVLSGGILDVRSLKTLRTSSAALIETLHTSEVCADPVNGVLLGSESYADKDVNHHSVKLYNSDLLFMQYRAWALRQNKPVKGLRQYWSYAILNTATVAVFEDCLGLERGSRDGHTFSKDSRELAIVCRTPIGIRVPRMLHDFAAALGRRDIKNVTVYWESDLQAWMMLFRLTGSMSSEPVESASAAKANLPKGKKGKKGKAAKR